MDGKNKIPAQAFRVVWVVAIIRELGAGAVIFIHATAIRSEPEDSPAIFINGYDVIVAQAFLKRRIIAVMNKMVEIRVPAVQPIGGADP